jgi:deazaflavin-dependent oxidoreductase (nitroreductase family)
MTVQQQLRKGLLTVLKHTLNPLTRRLARSRFGPFSIVRHIGRSSGKPYETPIIVAPIEGGFVIELTYGHDVDWHKNVLAAGGCRLIRHGQEYVIDKIEPLEAEAGLAAFAPPQRAVLRLTQRKHFEKWTVKQ